MAAAMLAVTHGMEPPGASDKWRVLQLLHESLPKAKARVERIDRIVEPEGFGRFVQEMTSSDNAEECGVAFFAPQNLEQLGRLCAHGFQLDDCEEMPDLGYGIPIASAASLAWQRRHGLNEEGVEQNCQGLLCVLLCSPELAFSGGPGDRVSALRELCVQKPEQLLLAYVIRLKVQEPEQETLHQEAASLAEVSDSPCSTLDSRLTERRRRQLRQQQRYEKVRDPLIKAVLSGLQRSAVGATGTVKLPGSSAEAEAVVSLYLLGGGAARTPRPPGVALREALGGVVVQRIENQPLYKQYMSFGLDSPSASKGPRYREDVVWHGTKLKRVDEDRTLAAKLQSIAEHGFDPQRCIKGAHADGGIWVATSPMESFGAGCDGLVAFILCLAKTHYNEWVDTSCARVLQRERVLPLYSLVHA